MSSYNYNTQNVGSNVTTNANGLDSGGYIAIQQGVAGNLYPSTTAYNIASTLTGLINTNAVNASAIVSGTINAPSVQTSSGTPTTETYPLSINAIAAITGNPIATVGFAYNNNVGSNTVMLWEDQKGIINAVQLGNNFLTTDQLQSVYSTYASDITSGQWNDPSFWANATGQLKALYNYYQIIHAAYGGYNYSSSSSVIPPTDLLGFLQELNQAPIWTGGPNITFNPLNLNGLYAQYDLNSQLAQTLLGDQLISAGMIGQFEQGLSKDQNYPGGPNVFDLVEGNSASDVGFIGGFTSVPTTVTASANDIYSVTNQSFFTTLNQTTGSSIPTTPSAFLQDYFNYFTSSVNNLASTASNLYGSTITVQLSSGGSSPTLTNIGTATLASVSPTTSVIPISSSSLTSSLSSSMQTSFYNGLYSAFDQAYVSSGAASNPIIQKEGEQTLFNNTFSAFMNAVYNGTITVASMQDLLNNWSLFVGPSVTLGSSSILSYQQIYDTFFPGGTEGNFLSLLNAFVSQFTQSAGGVFNSSLMADQWYSTVQNSYLLANNLTVNNSQPLLQSNFSEVKIIFALYSLLINVLGDIQKLTAMQAQYDSVLVKLEGAYTTEIAGIPDNLIGANIPGGVNVTTALSSTQLQTQSSLESQISNATQKWVSNITSFNTLVSNQEKNQTTTISQSNEAANQQSNLINSVLQELQSLLQSIWR